MLDQWAEFFPVARCTQAGATALELPGVLTDFAADTWVAGFDAAKRVSDLELLGAFYSASATAPYAPAPQTVRSMAAATWGDFPRSDVAVTNERDRAQAFVAAGTPVVLVSDSESADRLRRKWGLRDAQATIRFVAAGEPTDVLDAFPGLRLFRHLLLVTHHLQPCAELWIEIGATDGVARTAAEFAAEGDVLLFDAARITPAGLLDRVDAQCERRSRSAES